MQAHSHRARLHAQQFDAGGDCASRGEREDPPRGPKLVGMCSATVPSISTYGAIQIPCRQLHISEDIWGAAPTQFDTHGFLKSPDLAKSPNYCPIGGGQNLCPGRFVALRGIVAFVACLLLRFDVQLAQESPSGRSQAFPRADDLKPRISMVRPAKGDDVRLLLRLRDK
jgi:Cytochrome P450